MGVIIGKKGARIRQIEQDTGVTSINVNGDTGQGAWGSLPSVLFL